MSIKRRRCFNYIRNFSGVIPGRIETRNTGTKISCYTIAREVFSIILVNTVINSINALNEVLEMNGSKIGTYRIGLLKNNF